MNKICMGCGLKLQNKDPNSPGYTKDLTNTYCIRCFKLKNYGELIIESKVNNQDILKKVNNKTGIAFFLIDYLNLNSSTISYFKEIKIPKVLIISKCDILRKEMSRETIKNWLKKVYTIEEDILFISKNKNYNSSNIFQYLENKPYKTIYIMGITNAGKSTFINNILKKRSINKEILVSNKENTTLDFIKLNLGDYTLYDTPGFTYFSMGNSLINKEIKPLSFQLKGNTTIIINQNYKYFFKEPNKVILYLTTDDVTRKFSNTLDTPEKIKIKANHDLVLPGLGFLNIKEPCEISTNYPKYELRIDISES